ncbi:hypothetical protein DICPUDRAFT_153870 [Dictyostelium purpureum]|uniref:FNIP repeat-containing protein n=1 Tax=Dictyostelium purpureum TaxID=5786 RepID=F0ZPY4_DICPU|nr:uncharacterized protein DICPUDRAFT_153870 [Dictyostelium purpureum]EGC33998.1 hypothetical protein DICPUDRAFT_153870 [Dictyostelium purpureum]|eukprot:XP_003289484.1 hypothetical protein DICPUDRAFT_153870 [Dictyostelium purpureum]
MFLFNKIKNKKKRSRNNNNNNDNNNNRHSHHSNHNSHNNINNINNNNSNNRDINNNSYNEVINILFYKVWKNKYLKNIILGFMLDLSIKYKVNQDKEFKDTQEFINFQEKEYLSNVCISFQSSDLVLTQKNIKSINYCNSIYDGPGHYKSLDVINSIKNIPQWLTSVELPSGFDIRLLEGLDQLESLKIINFSFNQFKIEKNILQDSITKLSLVNYESVINREWVPSNLKKLDLKYSELYRVQVDSLPDSLTDLSLYSNKHQFDFNSRFFTKNLVSLKIHNFSNFEIEPSFQFPETLTSLHIGINELPRGFKFPKGMEHLFLTLSKVVNPKKTAKIFSKLVNLVELKLEILMEADLSQSSDDAYDISILPRGLKILELGNTFGVLFNEPLLPNQLPPSLEHLEFINGPYSAFSNKFMPLSQDNIFPASLTQVYFDSGFNQSIGTNAFPKNGKLKELAFGEGFNKVIDQYNIPPSLERLIISNENYHHIPIIVNNPNLTIQFERGIEFKEKWLYYTSRPKELLSISFFGHENLFGTQKYSLKNKINLENLDLGYGFSKDINENDLPLNNKIKTLTIGNSFRKVLNLDYFKNLETIVIGFSTPIIKTSNINNNTPNFYKLKQIKVPLSSIDFISDLDPIFYQFLKIVSK